MNILIDLHSSHIITSLDVILFEKRHFLYISVYSYNCILYPLIQFMEKHCVLEQRNYAFFYEIITPIVKKGKTQTNIQ